MPRPRRQAKNRLDRPLDFREKFDLMAGPAPSQPPGSERSPWPSEEVRRQAWAEHREELLRWPHVRHSRPTAFWQYDGPPELRGSAISDRALEAARWRWLEVNGALIDGEAEAIAAERTRRAAGAA